MEASDYEMGMFQAVVQQLWRKGCFTPEEARTAQAFTGYVNRLASEQAQRQAKKEEVKP